MRYALITLFSFNHVKLINCLDHSDYASVQIAQSVVCGLVAQWFSIKTHQGLVIYMLSLKQLNNT